MVRRYELRPEFLMAARRQKNQLSLGGDPAINRVIGCGIASVQCDHYVSVLQRYERKDIPLVIFSSSWNEIEIERALALGAREFIQKPMDIQSFAAAVCGMVEKWARKDCQSAQGGV